MACPHPIPRKLYLAGPISHVSYGAATDWRRWFEDAMAEVAPHVTCASPMRAKDYLSGEASISVRGNGGAGRPLSTDRAIMTRDHWDCQSADAIVANLLGAERVSIGTVMEIAWAHAYRKPLILVMEDQGNLHDHPMVTEAMGFRVNSLEQAVGVCKAVLSA